MGAGERRSGVHGAPRRRPRGVRGRHDGDSGEGLGGRCATAFELCGAPFEDSPGFNLGVPVHGRSLAADEARARESRLTAGSRGIGSKKARKRSQFWMGDF